MQQIAVAVGLQGEDPEHPRVEPGGTVVVRRADEVGPAVVVDVFQNRQGVAQMVAAERGRVRPSRKEAAVTVHVA